MEININSLVSIERVLKEAEAVFRTVDEIGKVIILENNEPAYILLKYEGNDKMPVNLSADRTTYTLQEAMKIVLSEAKNRTLHASELADIIYDKKLYVQKNGEKAKYNQIRARCGHYPEIFEALPGNYIRLK
ncbi:MULTISPECIES: hypothetical protein [Dehalobacter]|uniref:Uncharacterized protein n=1 Tax=Dehalobacter restrictus TaxID=55583 RepID=A0A857DKY5_9FIRM|nr:hypothetical protein [Dehalobacter restrictus]QHA01055.1 hypothetical protein GQ588_10640 [Dehalobacter restrictus]UWG95953.1 hypothetical protein LPY66_13675 [Dehalobacter sp. DCM]